jgi:hypothetical protein
MDISAGFVDHCKAYGIDRAIRSDEQQAGRELA